MEKVIERRSQKLIGDSRTQTYFRKSYWNAQACWMNICSCQNQREQELCSWNTMPTTAHWSCTADTLEKQEHCITGATLGCKSLSEFILFFFIFFRGHSDLDLWPSDPTRDVFVRNTMPPVRHFDKNLWQINH